MYFKETKDMYKLKRITLQENCISGLINLSNYYSKNYSFLDNSLILFSSYDAIININSGKSVTNICII